MNRTYFKPKEFVWGSLLQELINEENMDFLLELFQLSPQCRAADAQQFGGFGFVASGYF